MMNWLNKSNLPSFSHIFRKYLNFLCMSCCCSSLPLFFSYTLNGSAYIDGKDNKPSQKLQASYFLLQYFLSQLRSQPLLFVEISKNFIINPKSRKIIRFKNHCWSLIKCLFLFCTHRKLYINQCRGYYLFLYIFSLHMKIRKTIIQHGKVFFLIENGFIVKYCVLNDLCNEYFITTWLIWPSNIINRI